MAKYTKSDIPLEEGQGGTCNLEGNRVIFVIGKDCDVGHVLVIPAKGEVRTSLAHDFDEARQVVAEMLSAS